MVGGGWAGLVNPLVWSLSLCQTPVSSGVLAFLTAELGSLLYGAGPGGHVDEDDDEQHHHEQRRQYHGRHLLPGFLHGLLTLLLVLGRFFLGFPFELPHDVYSVCSQEPETEP